MCGVAVNWSRPWAAHMCWSEQIGSAAKPNQAATLTHKFGQTTEHGRVTPMVKPKVAKVSGARGQKGVFARIAGGHIIHSTGTEAPTE
jgi:hypothetical protein